MFETWYVLSFEYSSAMKTGPRTKTIGYLHLDEAIDIFKKLELSYQYDVNIRVRCGDPIKISKASLYEIFDFYRKDAIEDFHHGKGNKLYEAQGVSIDIA